MTEALTFQTNPIIDVERIMEMIPHRYPILLVDRVVQMELGESILSFKNVTCNEPHFTGHFPSKPIMPGVLLIEAMAQTCAILVVKTMGEDAEGKLVYFMSIDKARFRRPVVPGDRVYFHAEKERCRGNVWRFKCVAYVDEKKVAEATVQAMIMDK